MFASSKRGLFQSEECSGNGSHFFALNNIKTTKRHEVSESLLSLANEEDDDVHFDKYFMLTKMDLKEKNLVEMIAKVIEEASDTDNNNEVLMAGQHYPSIHEFASAIPNHLLLGSLLEHLCFVYESNPSRAHVLFKVIGQRLAAMNLLSPLAISDEFSTVRLQHNRAFTELLNAATSSLYPQNLAASPHNPSVRPKEGLFQAQTSRYISEFEEICRLGKGSYGHVFKVMNKLDGQHYAVKKILIKKVSKDDCMKVLREVKVLSSLHHVNVVGYHTAWMEHVQPTASPTEPHLPALESPAERDSPGGQSPDNSSHGSSIVFQSLSQETSAAAAATVTIDDSESDKKSVQALVPTLDVGQIVCPKTRHGIPENFVPCVFLGKRTPLKSSKCPAMGWDSSVLLEEESSRSSMELNNNSCIDKDCLQWTDQRSHKSSNDVQFQLMLYIQMQLCERSLKEWISERNARPRGEGNKDPYSCVDTEHALCLLRNILEGVEYIHSRGIMHRDLKPRNIFLHAQDCHVRIGDFGLACKKFIADGHINTVTPINDSSLTTGVGTFVYAAPEQLSGSDYDSKSDMYSIGVLALELFQPFGTEMERVRTLGDLREGKIPDTFCQRWPVLAKYIMRLISLKPADRPTASQMLQSELFCSCSKDMVIHGLQRKVEEQEEEILQLRRKISQLQSSKDTIHFSDLSKT